MPVRAGEPILTSVRAVRVALLGGQNPTNEVASKEYDLKRPVRDLFERLARLDNGTVIRLEFRQVCPFLVETTPIVVPAPEACPEG